MEKHSPQLGAHLRIPRGSFESNETTPAIIEIGALGRYTAPAAVDVKFIKTFPPREVRIGTAALEGVRGVMQSRKACC